MEGRGPGCGSLQSGREERIKHDLESEDRGIKVREEGRRGGREKGRKGEGEEGRRGGREKGRKGEGGKGDEEEGRRGGREKGRKGE